MKMYPTTFIYYAVLCQLVGQHTYIFLHTNPVEFLIADCNNFWLLFARRKTKKHKNNNQNKTPNSGYLGSRNDEERSEMRYAVRIAEFRESSELWTHIAPQGIPWSMFVSVASEHLPQGPTRPLNKGFVGWCQLGARTRAHLTVGSLLFDIIWKRIIQKRSKQLCRSKSRVWQRASFYIRERRACRVREKSHSRPNLQQRGSRPVRRLPIADCF